MGLTGDQERLEHNSTVTQMHANVDTMRFDMAMENRKLARQTWGIVLSGGALIVGAFAAGAAWYHSIHP